MASTPPGLPDERKTNVGTRTGPPQGPPFAGDDFLANQTYVVDCNGNTAKNPGKPGFSYDPPEASQGVVVEADGTVKKYFVQSGEDITDYYCRNQGISTTQYNALSDENKKNYCDEPIGGTHYSTSPDCGSYVRQVSRSLGVDIWYPKDDPPPQPDCKPTGQGLGEVTVTGSNAGTAYGSGPYAISSDVGTAAVHAGLINIGDVAVIAKKSAGPDKISNFSGSTRNGVTSLPISNTINGAIKTLAVTDSGDLASLDVNITPLSGNNGKDASIRVNIIGGQIFNTFIDDPGYDYKVGDQFEVTSLGFGGSERPGILTVTEVKQISVQGQCGMDLELVNIISENGPSSPGCDRTANQVESTLVLGNPPSTTVVYRTESDVGLTYPENAYLLNEIVTLFDSIVTPSTDPVAVEAVAETLQLFQQKLGRPPKGIEFQTWVRIIYDDGGNPSQTTLDQFDSDFANYINQNIDIIYCASDTVNLTPTSPAPGPSPSPTPSKSSDDCECIYDRNDFYVGTNGTNNGEVSLNEIWNFLGSPRNNPTSVCPRPENDAGLAQDNEPDLSDFFGMSLQRWVRCNANDDMGCVEEIVVPCPEVCEESVTVEDGIAEWNDDWRVTWNDGNSKIGQFVKTALNPTIEALNNKYLTLLGRPAERVGLMGDNQNWEGWYNQALRIGLDATLANIEIAAEPELARGGVLEFVSKCAYASNTELDLSFFLETRIAPWWGEQELEAPTLTMQKQKEFIYMVNVPPTQNTTYFFKASPSITANGKRFFEVYGSVDFPEITGAGRPGEPAITPGNNVKVTWYSRSFANPDLLIMGGADSANGGAITENYGCDITISGDAWTNKTSGMLYTTFTEADARDGETVNPDILDYNQAGVEFFCKIEIDNRPINPKVGTGYLPGFGGLDNNISSYLSNGSRFILNNIDCQDATISCSGNSVREVKTNEPTTITFSMNISTNCLAYRSGTAKISIRRFWPCPTFSPTSPTANQWIVQKQSVAIPQTSASSAQITYTLQVPTNKLDYLAGEDGVDVAPGDCHWRYYAYWEIDYPGVSCSANAWQNPGCNFGEGKQQLDQIYCIQDQNCVGGGPSGPSGGCVNDTDVPDSSFDFDACLPLCSSYSTAYFYWYYTTPQPGVNCSGPANSPSPGPDDGPAPGESPFGPGCECPICEQSIFVRILEGTECGILGPPNQQEGADKGPNNGAMDFFSEKEGLITINDYTTNPTVLPQDVITKCDPDFVPGATADDDCLVGSYDAWVYLTRKTFDTLTTLGNDAAIRIIDYDTGEVDCDETVFTQVEFFREITYKNGTTSGLQPQGVWLGGPEWNATLAKYNPGAGTNTDLMGYAGEEGISSKKRTFGFIDTIWDKETYKGIKYSIRITSSNDYLGNALYHPPPAGFIEADFDTVNTVVSLRGSQGAGPNNPGIKGPIFGIVNVSVSDKQNVPEFTEPTGITCPTGEIPYQDLDKLNYENCCCAGTSCFDYFDICDGFDDSVCPAEPLEEVVFCATSGEEPPPAPTPAPAPAPAPGPAPGPAPSPGPITPPNPGPINPPGFPSIER